MVTFISLIPKIGRVAAVLAALWKGTTYPAATPKIRKQGERARQVQYPIFLLQRSCFPLTSSRCDRFPFICWGFGYTSTILKMRLNNGLHSVTTSDTAIITARFVWIRWSRVSSLNSTDAHWSAVQWTCSWAQRACCWMSGCQKGLLRPQNSKFKMLR